MIITSPEFESMGRIPKKFSCQGKSINPTLEIEQIPEEAKVLALIMDDPDAPKKTFVHWVLYNIPICHRIEENSIPGLEGVNTSGEIGYFPPCPPSGSHRYFFKLYALDSELDVEEGVTKEDLLNAMQGHILAEAELVGTYQKH
jgi:Raf kinase inhibitor-like YbhB/YbcL family protein